MSIDELAELSGLSTAFIGLIERGQRGCGLHNLLQFSDILGVPVEELLYSGGFSSDLDNGELDSKNRHINALLRSLEEPEADFIISVLQSLMVSKKNIRAVQE